MQQTTVRILTSPATPEPSFGRMGRRNGQETHGGKDDTRPGKHTKNYGKIHHAING